MVQANFSSEMRKSFNEISGYMRACNVPDLTLTENADLAQTFRFVLNHYEFMCAGLRNGDFDERLLRDSEKGTILGLFRCCETYIYKIRDNRERQSIYEHLEWAFARWDKNPPGRIQRWWESYLMRPMQGRRAEQNDK